MKSDVVMVTDVNTKGIKTYEMVIFPKSNAGSLNVDVESEGVS